MKVFVIFAAACIAASFAVEANYGDADKYGDKSSYGEKEEYGYESRDKSSGYHGDDYSEKKAYGSKQEYGKEESYGYESKDKSYHGNDDYKHDDGYGKSVEYRQGVAYNKQYVYHGKYNGVCDNDGFYYRDYSSFVICSNNNAYVQSCAPGSRNSGHDAYNYGGNYYYRDFCDVNLVDHGYGVKHGYHGDRYGADHGKDYGRHAGAYGNYGAYDRYGGYHGDYRAPRYPYGY